jgi:CRP-like cAMP-binding protein
MLSQRIRQLANLAEDAVLFDAPTRLLHRLKSLAENYGVTSPDGAGVIIRHSLSQQEIADSIGLTRVSVNRHLRKWNLEGLIEYGRGFIRIPDIHRLESRIQKPDYSA